MSAAHEYEEKIRKNVRKMALHIVDLRDRLNTAKNKIAELEQQNASLGREIVNVRKHNARHLNEIQRLALERDRYAKALDMLGIPKDECECPTDH